eukprot:TRINITY_DN59825_c0_g1_i1.p1 TRINITY_DN59825_c0_g1~~TRINITY_DN59825_c0_g1_i1.p1  ORF type:complete len:865 (-),score=87.34 TRINITY_DN59825_c0_g1_i1:1139-3733(-)
MDRNTTEWKDDDGFPPYEIKKQDRLDKLVSQMTFPPTYTSNSPKEDLCLEFVEHFRGQYVQLFPTRAPLLLSPVNETGIKKFICTFVRPTQLPHEECYDYNTCAKYIANYITYEQLEEPDKLPTTVVSPTTTLRWQAGDCLDLSVCLLSILLGDGYDAYCVVGYATKEVTTNDQSRVKCPEVLPDETIDKTLKAASSTDKDKKQGKKPGGKGATVSAATKYTLRKRPDLQSKFQQKLEEKKLREAEEAMHQNEDETPDNGDDAEEDELYGQRVHCWILVQYGKRDIQNNFFIEPSTGDAVPLQSSSYIGIESVFNNSNYWVNMQDGKKISEMSFDLRDLNKWEYIFLTDVEVDDEDAEAQERKHHEDLTSDQGDAGDQILDLPASWVQNLTLSRQQYENRFPGLTKTLKYKDAKVELFSAYSEPDLKVKRITYIDDLQEVYERHTFFSFRTDKLRRRSEYNATNKNNAIRHEWFDEGRRRDQTILEALKEHILEEGKYQEMRFYWKARLDGLAKRTELFHSEDQANPKKVLEYFQGREDRLVARSASYDPPSVGVTISVPSGPTRNMDDNKPNPKKMTETFERNPAVPADEDVYKRTFYNPSTPEGQIRIIYHYADGKITRPSRIYSKGQPVTVESVDAFAKPLKPAVLSEEMRMLFIKEKECLTLIRDSEKEAKEILAQRQKEEQNVESVTTVYDTLRNKPKEDEQAEMRRKLEEQQRSVKKKDYLAPYIEQFVRSHTRPQLYARGSLNLNEIKLTKDEAQKVKEACLKDLKDRLIQRAHIMQTRLDEEKAALARRQSNFQKNQEQLDSAKEHEDYLQFCEEAMWRIHILEKRLERHQEQSLHRYAELDQKLRQEPKLAALHS